MKNMIAAQIVFGLIPAFFMIMMALAAVVVGTDLGVFFLLGATAGTFGMGWAIFGYGQRRAIVVLLLLVIGELTMLRALIPVLMQIASGQLDILKGSLGLYLTLALFVVGAAHVVFSGKQAFSRKPLHVG